MRIINTEAMLKAHLKLFKYRLTKEGVTDFQLYPAFCAYYNQNRQRYHLPKETVLTMACEVFVDGMEAN